MNTNPTAGETANRTTDRPAAKGVAIDKPVDAKVVLSGLWISTMLVFAYVDIFGFWRADVINGALAGRVPGAGFEVDQAFLVYTTMYVTVPAARWRWCC